MAQRVLVAIPACTRSIVGFFALVALATPIVLASRLSAEERDIASLVSTGRLEASVLDVLDSDERAPVIVSLAVELPPRDLDTSEGRALVAARGGQVLESLLPDDIQLKYQYVSVPAIAGSATLEGVLRLARHPRVLRVGLDQLVTASLLEAAPLVRVDDVQNLGFSGLGVKVAVLDSGVNTGHSDLGPDIVEERCFCDANGPGPGGECCPDGTASQSGPGSAEDLTGHGTAVTGIITSTGLQSPQGGAPDAEIVAIRVLNFQNVGWITDIVAGLDWIITDQPTVKLVNMSWVSNALFPGDCDASFPDVANAIQILWDNGVVAFASSGNDASVGTMAAPACIAKVVSVGAVYDEDIGPQDFGKCDDPQTQADQLTCYSNTSPKTDLLAPGSLITTTSHSETEPTTDVHGTSFASPLAASCAALLLEAQPGLTATQLVSKVTTSPKRIQVGTIGRFPRLDCYNALWLLFEDGFESSDFSAWSLSVP